MKARKQEESDVEVESSDDAPSEEEVDASGDEGSEEEQDDEDEEEEVCPTALLDLPRMLTDHAQSGDEPEKKDPSLNLASISFGDLAKAHAAISKKSKKSAPSVAPTKVIPAKKPAPAPAPAPSNATRAKPKKRSKNAPTEVTSKKPVSRRRDIISDTRPKARDPRFDAVDGEVDDSRFRKAYAFLDGYRDDEIKQLRGEIKKTKDEYAKEELKRELKVLENKRVTDKKKAERDKVLEKHKREEKELVRQGKTPFYLKEAEQKKRVLTERFQDMGKGQAEKVIIKRRKKEAVKDRMELEEVQRATGMRAERG
ncbi:MAG: hypothetical protein IMZ46_15280 [Acidobacteria bacterium]|nr:hypothetical protein [Acidobacteriota bacterium]